MTMKIHRLCFLVTTILVLWGCERQTEAGRLNETALSYTTKNRDSVSIIAGRAFTKGDATSADKSLSIVLSSIRLGYREKDSAISILKEARTTLLKKNEKQAAMASALLGMFYQMTLAKDSTLKYFRQAEEVLQGEDGHYSLFRQTAYAGLALLSLKEGQYQKSVLYYKKSLDVGITKNPQDYGGLANVYLELEDAESARYYAKEALKLTQERENKIFSIMCSGIVASTFAMQDAYDSAYHYSQQALTLMGDSPHSAQMLYKSAKYSLGLGRRKEAIGTFKKAINMIEDSEYERLRSHHYYSLAEAYRGANSDSLRSYGRKALALAIKQFEKMDQKIAANLLAEHFQGVNQLDSAYFYLNLSATLQEELFRDELANQLTDLRVEIQTLEKEKELQIAQNQRIEAVNQRTQIIALSGSGFLLAVVLFIGYRQKNLRRQLVLEKEKKGLTSELERNKQLLSTQMLNMIHKNNGFTEIAENLKNGNGNGQSSKKIKHIIDVNMALEKDWGNFNAYFSEVHGDFYGKLKRLHQSLSITETRLCSMVKMGLKNKEMATILNIEYSSITMAKYRLKKKFDLAENEDLDSHIHSL